MNSFWVFNILVLEHEGSLSEAEQFLQHTVKPSQEVYVFHDILVISYTQQICQASTKDLSGSQILSI